MSSKYDDDGILDYFVDLKRKRERQRVTMEWNDELTVRLILAVRRHAVLWNTRAVDYRIKMARERAWREISDESFNGQVDITEISVKWTNLRIQFRSCYAKNKLAAASEDLSKWKFYKHMKFIVHEMQPNGSETNEVSHYIGIYI